MSNGYLVIDGRRFVIVDEADYSRLLAGSTGAPIVAEEDLPPLPKPKADGTVPAMEFARAVLARKLITERAARGWSQTDLARQAGVRLETVNRLENARHTANPGTAKKIQDALDAHRPTVGTRRRAAGNGAPLKRAVG